MAIISSLLRLSFPFVIFIDTIVGVDQARCFTLASSEYQVVARYGDEAIGGLSY